MIKPNDLRIGNLILAYNNDGKLIECEVWGVDGHTQIVHIKGGFIGYKIQDITPIQLTEEWLLRFGFEKTIPVDQKTCDSAYQIPSWGRIVLKNGRMVSDEYYFLDGLTQDIKHVHQLQNLYFALTGKELKFNS